MNAAKKAHPHGERGASAPWCGSPRRSGLIAAMLALAVALAPSAMAAAEDAPRAAGNDKVREALRRSLPEGWVELTDLFWRGGEEYHYLVLLAAGGMIAAWAVLIPTKFWEGREGDAWLRRGVMLVSGMLTGMMAYALDAYLAVDWPAANSGYWPPQFDSFSSPMLPLAGANGQPTLFGYMAYFGMLFALVRWWRLTDPGRRGRLTIGGTFGPAAAGYLLPMVWHFLQPWALVWAVLIAVTVQLVSPVAPAAAKVSR